MPAKLTLGEAAKAAGKSKPTIHRAIKSGKISAEKNASGSYQIDPAELFRVYEALPRNSNVEHHMKRSVTRDVTPPNPPEYWQALHEASEQERGRERQQLEETIADLRARLDASEEERRATQARLEDMRKRPRWRFW